MLDLQAVTLGGESQRPRRPPTYYPPWAMGRTEYELWTQKIANHVPPEGSTLTQPKAMELI